MATKSKLSEDLLTGGGEIAEYIGWPRWRVYKHPQALGLVRIDGIWTGRKSIVDRRLGGDPAPTNN